MRLWLVFYPSGCHTLNAYKNTHFPTALYFPLLRPRHSFAVFYWLVHFLLSSISYLLDMMQFTPSFILILGILFRVTLDAYAIPLTPRQKGILTLPLERTPMRRDLHPLMVCTLVSCSGLKQGL